MTTLTARLAFLAALATCMAAIAHADEAREAVARHIIEESHIDGVILAQAKAKAAADPRIEERVESLLYKIRPAALWGPSHPAWPKVRAALLEHVAKENERWVAEYWPQAMKIHVMELAGSLRLPDLQRMDAFAVSPGGKAYFAKRLTLSAVKEPPEMPFSLEPFIRPQTDWIADVLATHYGDAHYTVVDRWTADLNQRFAAILPVDSKKQVLGTLELRADTTLVFRFEKLALEIPKAASYYAETLALAPGLAIGKPRVLYRDNEGVISDRP